MNGPSSRKCYYPPFFPSTPSSRSQTIEGISELKQCLARTLGMTDAKLDKVSAETQLFS